MSPRYKNNSKKGATTEENKQKGLFASEKQDGRNRVNIFHRWKIKLNMIEKSFKISQKMMNFLQFKFFIYLKITVC
ncbi:MAG TPA: hypothetical protein DIT10_05245 [Chryseobacterium sp.]|nr:hypothetical protein [Chryseobacterium sp.]